MVDMELPFLKDEVITDGYHNTTELFGDELEKKERKINAQERLILNFFLDNPNDQFTPPEVWYKTGMAPNTPLTSIRRAITNLTPDYLINTHNKKMGIYGDSNNCWKLKP